MLMRFVFIMMLLFTSTANAEVKIYNGTGEYIMSEFETLDIAKQRAKQKAERHAQEQAGVYVGSYTKVKNAQVSEDEIITITSGIMNVVDVDYEVTPLDKGKSIHIVAKIKANIDTDDINKWLAKGIEERSNLAAQNKELQKAIAEQDKQIAELKKQLADVKTQQDKDRITQKFANEDKIFLSNQKVEEAHKYYDKGDYYSVIGFCNQAIELNPNNYQAYGNRGIAYSELQNYKQAIEDYTKAIQINPNDGIFYYNRGIAYDDVKNYKQAIADYDKAIELDPNYAGAYNNRGIAYGKLQNYKQAIEDFNKTIQLNPNDAKAYNNRGNAYYGLQNYDNAYDDFFKAIELNPNNKDYHTKIISGYPFFMTRLKNIPYGIAKLSEIIGKYPNNAYAYLSRARLYIKLEQYDKATDDYNKSVTLRPNDVSMYRYRSNFYSYIEKYSQALNDYSKVIEFDPNNAKNYQQRGWFYEKLSQYENAISDFLKSINLSSDNDDLEYSYYHLSICYRALGNIQKSQEYFSKYKSISESKGK